VALTVTLPALAQAPAGEQPGAPGGEQTPRRETTPPRLVSRPPGVYPEAARAEGREAVVDLRLTIDAEGRVTSAEIPQPVGHGFDEAARDAALGFRFEPALRDGTPVAARIVYRYAFELELEPEPPLPEPERTAKPSTAAAVEQRSAKAAPAPAPKPEEPSVEVLVRGAQTDAERLQQSAEAVTVVDTRKAQQRTADMGDILARTPGVVVRRSGGLGSETSISLNGLYDDQVRYFIDGIPLRVAGYPLDVANVPVNLVERLELYRGVVPIRFGADALGGAVNLVTDQRYETRLGASYQVGSFGTHRVSASGRYRHEPTNFILGLSTFFDLTQNNYEVDVHVPGPDGRQVPVTVPRFHDAYAGYGATLEAGVVDQPWARRLLLKAFQTGYEKEIQNNNVMEVVYGEVRSGETIRGLTGLYEVDASEDVSVELVTSYAHRVISYTDAARWVYNWFGQRVSVRRTSAEADEEPEDNRTYENALFARMLGAWTVAAGHVLRGVVTPRWTTRTGDELIQDSPTAFDPLNTTNRLATLVSGFEYESNWFGNRLSNIAFVKDYLYATDAREEVPENDSFRDMDIDVHRLGFGDSLRYRFTPWLLAKASYEYTTRLPEPDEVFGDAEQVAPNLDLKPEVSHNANVGPRLEIESAGLGEFTLDVNAFVRATDQQIILLVSQIRSAYENVYTARSSGLEGSFAISTLERTLHLDGALTWQDIRNTSSAGKFADFEGDPIPNRPHLFGSWGASVRVPRVGGPRNALELYYSGLYVHGFYRSWESAGVRSSKQLISAQTTHDAGVTWSVKNSFARVASTFEIDNFTDAKVYDEFGLQRPGRAFYVKVSGEL
jgi:vitamin B12 transporter